MLNLYDYISELDWKRIENYISLYGTKEGYKGNEEYLDDWRQCKKKLFHLFGGELIKRVPFEFEMPKELLKRELTDLINTSSFREKYIEKIETYCFDPEHGWRYKENIPAELWKALNHTISTDCFCEDKMDRGVKYKKEGAKNTLQISIGMKPMRALQKVLVYFDWYDELKDDFEEFRIKHSLLLNEKYIKGNLCLSIHPLDFMTMSDNASDWSSCMNWTNNGCYHVGTVEMMNANNVICCYVDSSKPYNFGKKNNTGEEYEWNNKKWRQLFYVNKDIIVAGKAYPYRNKDFTLTALEELRKLAKENLKWNYSFGPELYKDMVHVTSLSRMDNNKNWLRHGDYTKHNILFDTKGMYNDMLNDNTYPYWCIRNKVEKPKIISYSGKAKCLCCNNDVIEEDDDFYYYGEDSYNTRYTGVGRVLCYDCSQDRHCDWCGDYMGEILPTIDNMRWCRTCYSRNFKVCPECGDEFRYPEDGKKMILMMYKDGIQDNDKNREDTTIRIGDIETVMTNNYGDGLKSKYKFNTLCVCEKCKEEWNHKGLLTKVNIRGCWSPWSKSEKKEIFALKDFYDREDDSMSNYYSYNLKNPIYPKDNI